jgi:hypothetical protein
MLALLVTLPALAAGGCADQQPEPPKPPAAPAAPPGPDYAILPGRGLEKCEVDGPVRQVRELFGRPDRERDQSLSYYRRGVQVLTDRGQIDALIFLYRSRTHMTFDGVTDKGVGMWSTIPDVIKRYGEPERIGDSTVSEFGEFPGAHEFSLEYPSQGIAFTFYDNELADVRVYAKRK